MVVNYSIILALLRKEVDNGKISKKLQRKKIESVTTKIAFNRTRSVYEASVFGKVIVALSPFK